MGFVTDFIGDIFGAPDPINPIAVAGAQGAENLNAARATAALNRVNQITPFGSLTYSRTPGGNEDSFTATTKLDPRTQRLLDQQLETSLNLGNATSRALNNVNSLFSAGGTVNADEDYRKQVQDAIYNRAASRLNPRFAQSQSDMLSRLAAQGITPGSAAYDREIQNYFRDRNDAYQTAIDASIAGGETAISNQFGRDLQSRNQIVNELNALRSSQQVQTPQFQNMATGAQVQAAPVAQSIFNAQQQQQGQFGGLLNAAAGLGGAAIMASDRRLKSNIKQVGTLPNGLAWYDYDIAGERRSGVMADEVETVMPGAVTEINGIKHVDYAQVLEA